MIQDQRGNGIVVPTGKHEPEMAVRYDIANDVVWREGPNGEAVKSHRAIVHCLESNDGADIPQGDFDLVDEGKLIRLKHISDDPEWLVTSSIP